MDMVVLIFGAALIGATMHIAIGVGERVLVARVALRKQRKRCADGVAHGATKWQTAEMPATHLPRIGTARVIAAAPAIVSWRWR